ncbi:response regulator transcription factor [Burkholderia vietnamiensis]|nr:response regulator transcription factor [Burkholderia vietnamiensis]MBR8033602.1 response regulator transcription factor [Burkholderia vietnamiensis]MBR8206214.1 response regulator transcription factor [Burkholderia vietnamiensis]MBR8360329.1 response regulator transcription factor [Burkholderia vietnamiensis]QTK88667.1 response regulator transcription factor [Burkholderia vietnamiensis]
MASPVSPGNKPAPPNQPTEKSAAMAHVLTIEDDEITANEIVRELTSRGFTVEWVANGRDGMARALGNEFDVITLDRMLPVVDGLTILTTMRSVGVRTPVLMLSALGDVDERVRGLRAGGDDYLTKPFDPEEMAARLEVLLRRSQTAPAPFSTTLTVGPLRLDLVSRKVFRDGEEIALLPTEYRVLEYMMRNAGQTITRTMLFEAVWGYHFDPGTNLIEVHMGRLRKKIDPPDAKQMIQTVRGAGYILA